MKSESEKILNWLYRQEFPSGFLDFDVLLLHATKIVLSKSQSDAEAYSYNNRQRHWNNLLKRLENDGRLGRSPLFFIPDRNTRKLIWIPSNIYLATTTKEKQRALRIAARPRIIQTIDMLSARQYEALGCVICNMIGATYVLLTPRGNEGGIDFFATINFPSKCHVFHGNYKPLRIVGQSKKYHDKVQVDRIKELIETIDEVKNQNPSVERLVPPWFRTASGPIIGWLIAHSGVQSGALAKAQNHGIIISDSIDMAEIAAMSHRLKASLSTSERANQLHECVVNVLKIQ